MKHVFIRPVTATVGVAVAAAQGVRLAAYDVPLSLVVSSALAIGATLHLGLEHLAHLVFAKTYRCSEQGCAFRVRPVYADAAENRRCQEAAASHPRHLPTRRA